MARDAGPGGRAGPLALGRELHAPAAGVVPRDGQLIGISTAGDDEASPLGELRAKALALPDFRRDPENAKHKIATSASFAMHEWSLNPGDDHTDMKLIQAVNPASWLSDDLLREELESPSYTPWAHKRFRCGLWVAGEDGAISEKDWAACSSPGCEIPAEAEGVYVGVDLGWKWDTTAFVPVWRTEDGRVRVHPPAILVPPQDGTSLDIEEVFGVAEAMRDRWPSCAFVLDPEASGDILAQRIDAELGGAVLTHSQKSGPMTRASQLLSETIANGDLEHPNDDALNRHVLSASARFIGVGWRLDKPKGKSLPIDAAVALSMALRVLAADMHAAPSTEFIPPDNAATFA